MSLRQLLPLSRSFTPASNPFGRSGSVEIGARPDPAASARATPSPVADRPAAGPVPVSRRIVVPMRAIAKQKETGVARGGSDPAGGRREMGRRGFRLMVEQMLLTLLCPGNRRRGLRPGPVQTEMQFETLKVARNDLTTADVEVVIKTPGRREPLSAACRGRILRLWWEEGARRLRRLSTTLF